MTDKIVSVFAQQIIDCKCRPAVEVEIKTESGALGRGAAPTGTSVGAHEAFVLRDGNKESYGGLTVHKAIRNVMEIIAPAIVGMDVYDQQSIDRKMIALDGTPDKSRLGGNAIYSTSIAAFRAAADSSGLPLYGHIASGKIRTIPVPCFNVINGGDYGDYVQAFNEFLIVPYGTASVDRAIEMAVAVFQELHVVLQEHTKSKPRVASSYGYAAPSDDPEVILMLMHRAVERLGFSDEIAFALDCASSEFFDIDSRTYLLKGSRVSSREMIAYAKWLTEKFNLVFIEDLLDEEDWAGYQLAKEELHRTLLLGDDLTVSNLQFLQKAQQLKAIDGFVLKPNQVGTISEAMEAYQYARENNLVVVPSGRSGGVVDDVVMDLSVGLQVPFQKNGAPRSGERIEKLNFLMRASARNEGCRMFDIKPLLRFN
jgi:enolase